ncbi:hypothetical protein J0H33_10695 [bacterium]|nr:hypothetical protein [bacterium]
MTDFMFAVRLVHVIAGVSWLGEVITINFVLLPALFRATADDRNVLLVTVFPYIFRLATALGGLAIVSGAGLVLWNTRLDLSLLVSTSWGWRILVGGIIGLVIFVFHLVEESGAERSLAAELVFLRDNGDEEAAKRLLNHLAIFPRVGMLILMVVVGLMVAAVWLP